MTISIKAKTPGNGDEWLDAGIAAFDQEHEGVAGFAISTGTGHYRFSKDEGARLGKYLLEIPDGHAMIVLPLTPGHHTVDVK